MLLAAQGLSVIRVPGWNGRTSMRTEHLCAATNLVATHDAL